jgi:hypothetical protein
MGFRIQFMAFDVFFFMCLHVKSLSTLFQRLRHNEYVVSSDSFEDVVLKTE